MKLLLYCFGGLFVRTPTIRCDPEGEMHDAIHATRQRRPTTAYSSFIISFVNFMMGNFLIY